MDRIERWMANQPHLPDSQLEVKNYCNGRAEIKLGEKRGQVVHIRREGERYVLTSIVAGSARTANLEEDLRDLADRIWSRNCETDVVNFTFDRHNRLIGRIDHPAATLDAEELYFYLSRLAIECDRMEYLLTGKNVF